MGVTEDLEAWFTAQYAGTVASAKQWYDSTTHHGSFCGAGTRGDTAVDGLDSCCAQHDANYGAVGASADDMWSADALARTRDADQALVDCAGGADTTDPDYRDNLIWLFSTRVTLADAVLWYRARLEELDRMRQWLLSDASSPEEPSDETRQGYAEWTRHLEGQDISRDEIEAVVREVGRDPERLA
ncbi:MAG TPA: hypothetical protein VF855_07525 [Acidimicrobiales bacterium]